MLGTETQHFWTAEAMLLANVGPHWGETDMDYFRAMYYANL